MVGKSTVESGEVRRRCGEVREVFMGGVAVPVPRLYQGQYESHLSFYKMVPPPYTRQTQTQNTDLLFNLDHYHRPTIHH